MTLCVKDEIHTEGIQLLTKVFAPYAHANIQLPKRLNGPMQGYKVTTSDSPFQGLSGHGIIRFQLPAPTKLYSPNRPDLCLRRQKSICTLQVLAVCSAKTQKSIYEIISNVDLRSMPAILCNFRRGGRATWVGTPWERKTWLH